MKAMDRKLEAFITDIVKDPTLRLDIAKMDDKEQLMQELKDTTLTFKNKLAAMSDCASKLKAAA